jgi:pimeloyl-ACP methyl ester carboxylesterase
MRLEANMFTETMTAGVSAVSDPSPVTPSPRVDARPANVMGVGRFFASQNFHFQTLRALMESPSGSADTNEVLETVKLIVDGDVESWYAAWSALSERVLALAESTSDKLSKGNAYMRAYNYQRTAEFLLPPEDPKRAPSWHKSLGYFDKGLTTLGIDCEPISVPYLGGKLRAHYFPGPAGADEKPLIVLVGGFDSVLEELFPFLGRPALARGYSVLAYEGPGQGQPLRDGLKFTPEWEKPTSAVLDAFLATHAKPKQIVLIGMSMGGYFAPRAAAFESRIDGVVAWDTCFDMGDAAAPIMQRAADPKLAGIPDVVWAYNNARWTMGTTTVDGTGRAMAQYSLAPVADRIRQHVLVMAGEVDHFIPFHQTADFEKALINAKSVTTRMFSRASGGGEHCQTGNLTLVHATIFDWLLAKFA